MQERRFRKFQHNMLCMTEKMRTVDDLRRHDFGTNFLCAGSDQLWGDISGHNVCDSAYFLDFRSKGNKCFSYAASFGRTDFPHDYYEKIVPMLRKFSFLTVREESAGKLLQIYANMPSVTILDPTLMLAREEWLKLANCTIKHSPYIIVYQLYEDVALNQYAEMLSKKMRCKIIRVSLSIYSFLKTGKSEILKSPYYVLSLFKNAEAVVTNSFHATALSVIFNRPFVDFLPPKTQVRITDLLDMLGLQDRIRQGREDPMDGVIEWGRVNAFLAEKRQQATAYITEQLKKMETQA